MRATFFGIEIGKTGIQVSQLGLDVTGHNIANIDTKGYTRQRIVSTAYDPFATIGRALPRDQARVGGGVRVKILDQIRSAYLDKRYRLENTAFSYWNKRAESLSYVESFFDNVNEETSINFSLARFFEAMKVLSEDSVEGAPRKLLQTAGEDLTQQLNMIYDGLIELQESQDKSVEVAIGEINRIAQEIVDLNKSIYGFEITGHIANDLRDKRNLLLDELSILIDTEYEEISDGLGNFVLEVSIGGTKLVSHDKLSQLGVYKTENMIEGEADVWTPAWVSILGKNYASVVKELPPGGIISDYTEINYPNGVPRYILTTDLGNLTDLDMSVIKGGELKAYIDMRDNSGVELPGIPRYIEMLNNLARALVQEINTVHNLGWTDPPTGASATGVNFFYFDALDPQGIDQITAKNIRLSDEVAKSEYNIAASSEQIVKQGAPNELQRGNNENMNDLYALFLLKDIEVTLSSGSSVAIGSFDGFATSVRFDVANTLNYAHKTAITSNTLQIAAENQRVSVSGVSLDEEMTNIVKYQHAYSGAARVITAMDEVLDRLINGTGRVGL